MVSTPPEHVMAVLPEHVMPSGEQPPLDESPEPDDVSVPSSGEVKPSGSVMSSPLVSGTCFPSWTVESVGPPPSLESIIPSEPDCPSFIDESGLPDPVSSPAKPCEPLPHPSTVPSETRVAHPSQALVILRFLLVRSRRRDEQVVPRAYILDKSRTVPLQ
jgi:hypothetical protein